MNRCIDNVVDEKVQEFHKLRETPKLISCIKDVECKNGFGRTIKVGEKVMCNGLVVGVTSYEVAIPNECGFYDYENFEMIIEIGVIK